MDEALLARLDDALNGDPEAIAAFDDHIKRVDETPAPPLHDAASRNDAATLLALLDSGVSPDALHFESGALHIAVISARGDAVRVLLERGANPNLRDSSESTPLHWALRYGLQFDEGLAVVRLLLEYGANPNQDVDGDDLPLELAALEGNPEALALLLDFGANVNAADARGNTALISASHGSTACARFLIARGADPNVRPNSGWTPLRFAVHESSQEMVTLLLDAGADANALDNDGKSLLAFALEQNNSEIVELLKTAGAR